MSRWALHVAKALITLASIGIDLYFHRTPTERSVSPLTEPTVPASKATGNRKKGRRDVA